MTIGIYSIYWEEQDLIYIGQSQDIEKRWGEHKRALISNNHTNYKVQNTYNLYGMPTFNILEVCSISMLNTLEIIYTDEFNSLSSTNGLNIVEAGATGYGTNSSYTKYSRYKILKVFSLLYNTSFTYTVISDKTGVALSTIKDMKCGYTHLWIKEAYPIKYERMLHRKSSNYKNRGTLLTRTGKTVELISKDGTIYTIECINSFCKSIPELSINLLNSASGISKLIREKQSEYKGWKIHNISDLHTQQSSKLLA